MCTQLEVSCSVLSSVKVAQPRILFALFPCKQFLHVLLLYRDGLVYLLPLRMSLFYFLYFRCFFLPPALGCHLRSHSCCCFPLSHNSLWTVTSMILESLATCQLVSPSKSSHPQVTSTLQAIFGTYVHLVDQHNSRVLIWSEILGDQIPWNSSNLTSYHLDILPDSLISTGFFAPDTLITLSILIFILHIYLFIHINFSIIKY